MKIFVQATFNLSHAYLGLSESSDKALIIFIKSHRLSINPISRFFSLSAVTSLCLLSKTLGE